MPAIRAMDNSFLQLRANKKIAESTLALFVARVDTNDANDALALDDLALGADRFDRGSDLHR